ncbi:MAG: cytochrome P450 [Acidimicrobiales bacterium]|nr:cytochrome P450 [Acidimicrobiales bacterium]
MVCTYDDVYQVLRQHETYSSESYVNRNEGPPLLVLGQDPPIHTKYRRLLNPWLSPGIAERLAPKMEEYSQGLLDRLVPRGECDIVIEYGNPFPALVVLDLVGLPTNEWERFAEPNHALQYAKPGSPQMEEAQTGMMWIAGQIYETAAKRREDPADDLISDLATARVDGELIPLEDVVGITLTVVGGGVDTTTSLYANVLIHLNRNPDDRQRLIDDPSLIPTAGEEFLRHFTPAQILSRQAISDTELAGQSIAKGEYVDVCIASANHDEQVFPAADEIILDRFPNRHAAFGLGIHRCVGSNVARAMIQLMIRHTLERMPDFDVIEDQAQHYGGPIVNGWITLPIRFTPSRPRGTAPLPV